MKTFSDLLSPAMAIDRCISKYIVKAMAIDINVSETIVTSNDGYR